MLGASKILTVSYGTFSCTLEGFDEPFNTMKAIAEYFRDLAAEDRYFGAEPPTPDAAMLHKIAEREIQRRVEAKIQDNGVILRADSSDVARAAPPSLAAPSLAPAANASPMLDANGESLSARLSRLRASPALEDRAPQLPTDTAVALQDPLQAEAPESETLESVALPAAPETAPEPLHRLPEPLGALDDTYTEDQHAGEIGPEMLASVEALVAKPATEPLPPEPEANAPHEDSLAELEPEPVTQTQDSVLLEAAPEVSTPEVSTPEAFDVTDETESLLAKLARDIPASPAPQAEAAEPAPAPEPARLQTAEEALAEALGIAPPEARAMIGAAEPAPVAEADHDAKTAPEPAEAADPAPQDHARARVIRVRRLESAAQPPAGTTLLSEAAEAALLAELAALQTAVPAAKPAESERTTRPVRVLRPDPASPTPAILVQTLSGPEAAELRQGLTDLSKDDAVNRLIAQTNTALDDPESRRRSAAISHLKAAVAATEADRQLQDAAGSVAADRKSVYRSDLDSVVRPNPTARSAEDRTSPLVLVSEQRIDRPKPPEPTAEPAIVRPQRPVMPTRLVPAGLTKAPLETLIGADLDDEDEDETLSPEEASANLFAEGTSFADFAEQLGAQTLHDLLEASAVYCAQILGRPQFSRPLVMSQINTLPNAEKYLLEDQLRAFGTLMREGRIKKIKRGGFAVTDRSPLLAEALRNAG